MNTYAFETAAKKYQLESNGPIAARQMIDLRLGLKGFVTVVLAYNGNHRTFVNRTLQAAFRRLASVCAGKLKKHGEYAAAIVTPDNRVMTYHEAKLAYAHGIAAEVAASPVEPEETRVVFRKERGGDILAVFPDQDEKGLFGCFAHVGQHASCSYDYYLRTKPATEAESAALKRELESAPYNYRLRVVRRMTR